MGGRRLAHECGHQVGREGQVPELQADVHEREGPGVAPQVPVLHRRGESRRRRRVSKRAVRPQHPARRSGVGRSSLPDECEGPCFCLFGPYFSTSGIRAFDLYGGASLVCGTTCNTLLGSTAWAWTEKDNKK